MTDDTIAAEYQGNDITITSRAPLRGIVELIDDDDRVIALEIDRAAAEDLMSALAQFLAEERSQ